MTTLQFIPPAQVTMLNKNILDASLKFKSLRLSNFVGFVTLMTEM